MSKYVKCIYLYEVVLIDATCCYVNAQHYNLLGWRADCKQNSRCEGWASSTRTLLIGRRPLSLIPTRKVFGYTAVHVDDKYPHTRESWVHVTRAAEQKQERPCTQTHGVFVRECRPTTSTAVTALKMTRSRRVVEVACQKLPLLSTVTAEAKRRS